MAHENISQQLERLIAEAVRAGRYRSRSAFLKQIGLSSGYLSVLRHALQKNPRAQIGINTLRKFAVGLGVDERELYRQQDPAEEPPLVDIHPERAWAVAAARGLRFPEAAIQVVLRIDPGTRRPGRLWWFKMIEAEAEIVGPATESGSFRVDLSHPPDRLR